MARVEPMPSEVLPLAVVDQVQRVLRPRRVVASDGTHLGWLDHVRYERYADHPDEIDQTVRPRERTVVLHLDRSALERSPSA